MVGRGGDFRLGPRGGQVAVSSQRPPEGYRAGVLPPLDRSASFRGRYNALAASLLEEPLAGTANVDGPELESTWVLTHEARCEEG